MSVSNNLINVVCVCFFCRQYEWSLTYWNGKDYFCKVVFLFVLQTLWVTLLFPCWSGLDTRGRLYPDKKSPWTGYPATPTITDGGWLTVCIYDGGGGGDFFLAFEDFGRMFSYSFHACTFFFVFRWRLARAHLFHSLGQDQSSVAQRAETIVVECSRTSCVWARFRIGSHTMLG